MNQLRCNLKKKYTTDLCPGEQNGFEHNPVTNNCSMLFVFSFFKNLIYIHLIFKIVLMIIPNKIVLNQRKFTYIKTSSFSIFSNENNHIYNYIDTRSPINVSCLHIQYILRDKYELLRISKPDVHYRS